MSVLTFEPGFEPGVWFLSIPDPNAVATPLLVRVDGVTDDTLSDIEGTINEYLLAKVPLTEQDFDAAAHVRMRRMFGWCFLALVWMAAIGIVAFTQGKDIGRQETNALFFGGVPGQCQSVTLGHTSLVVCVDESGDPSWQN